MVLVHGCDISTALTAGLSQVNVEPLQIVSYQPGQRFNLHHDAGTLLEDGRVPIMVPPRRLVTLFLVRVLKLLEVSDSCRTVLNTEQCSEVCDANYWYSICVDST